MTITSPGPLRKRSASKRTARAWILVSTLAFVALGATVVVALTASPTVRKQVVAIASTAAGSTFEETAAHGYIPTGEMIELSEDSLPSLANLDPALLAAAKEAAVAAEQDGIHLAVTSGWRSATYQQWLLEKAIAKYGSRDEAAKWVSTPEVSRHVSGQAIDIGPFDATLWMQSNADRFGLCQIYANELWHYELAAEYGGSCPGLRESAAG